MTRNKPGRPRLDPTDRSVVVSLSMPARTFDRFYQRATVARVSVPEVIRRALSDPDSKKTETR